jgi:ribonuclease T2
MRLALRIAALSLVISALPSAWADPASGTFTASRACEAFQSFRKSTNPDGAKLSPGTGYTILESHNAGWTRVQVPGARPPERWVQNDCGAAAGGGAPPPATPIGARGPSTDNASGNSAANSGQAMCKTPDQYDSFVLAMSWQPGFCEWTAGGRRGKPECEAMEDGKLKVTNLTLHGLWPNRQQCGISYGDCGNAPMTLSKETISYIGPWMPNFLYEKGFGEHEWRKHGTCQTTLNPDAYFRRAVDLVKQFNDSSAAKYIRQNIGGAISRNTFYEKLKAETGSDAYRDSVKLMCSGQYLTEIQVKLPRDYKAGGTLKQLLGDQPSGSGGGTCRRDEIRIEASGR